MKTPCSPDGNLYFLPITLYVHVLLLLHYAFIPATFLLSRQHTHTYAKSPKYIIIMFLLTQFKVQTNTHNIFTGTMLTITWHSHITWTTIWNPTKYSSTLHHQPNTQVFYLFLLYRIPFVHPQSCHNSVSRNYKIHFEFEIAMSTTTFCRYSIFT